MYRWLNYDCGPYGETDLLLQRLNREEKREGVKQYLKGKMPEM
jgi:hypothetical protein